MSSCQLTGGELMQMHMCYKDESGTVEKNGTSHFVLLGLSVPSEQWKPYDRQIQELCTGYGLQGCEVHTAWMARRYVEQEKIPDFSQLSRSDRRQAAKAKREQKLLQLAALRADRRRLKEQQKNYKKTDAYIHLTLDERRNCLRDLADIVGGWQDARVFCEAICKSHFFSKNVHTPMVELAFTEVVQRFEYFLRNRGHFLGDTLQGLIVQDNNPTVAKRLTEMMKRFHRQGTRWTGIDHIIETPLFVDSSLTSMVQLADLCAYATRRFFENQEYDLFNRIYSRFDCAGPVIVGIRHFSDASCTCRVCRDHGNSRAGQSALPAAIPPATPS
jgi:hypothetical protein